MVPSCRRRCIELFWKFSPKNFNHSFVFVENDWFANKVRTSKFRCTITNNLEIFSCCSYYVEGDSLRRKFLCSNFMFFFFSAYLYNVQLTKLVSSADVLLQHVYNLLSPQKNKELRDCIFTWLCDKQEVDNCWVLSVFDIQNNYSATDLSSESIFFRFNEQTKRIYRFRFVIIWNIRFRKQSRIFWWVVHQTWNWECIRYSADVVSKFWLDFFISFILYFYSLSSGWSWRQSRW